MNREIKQCEIKGCDGTCHWIIKHDKENRIFDYPVKTKKEALATIEFHNLSGYHLEHKFGRRNNYK